MSDVRVGAGGGQEYGSAPEDEKRRGWVQQGQGEHWTDSELGGNPVGAGGSERVVHG